MSLSTHVLDSATGRPAAGMAVALHRRDGDGWTPLVAGVTDADGRLRLTGAPLDPGVHRLVFDTGPWHAAAGTVAFHPEVGVAFEVTQPEQHLHVPLLLSPFAYTTYRGS